MPDRKREIGRRTPLGIMQASAARIRTATRIATRHKKKDGIPDGLIIIAVPNPVRGDHFIYSFAKIWNPA